MKYEIVMINYLDKEGEFHSCGPFEEYSPEFVEAESEIFEKGGRVYEVESIEV